MMAAAFGVFFFTVTWIAPILFFIGIFCQTIRRSQEQGGDPGGHLPSEPFVLLGIGAWFLAINGPLLQTFATAMEYRLGAGAHLFFGENGLLVFRYAFGLAAISIIATLAKAFWTHVQLEENRWGTVINYRTPLRESGAFQMWSEYLTRCGIAVVIVLMQKKLTELSKIQHIHEIDAAQRVGGINSPSQAIEAEFVVSFSTWLGEFPDWEFIYMSL